MVAQKNQRIAVIGAGISGIAAANILKKNGYEAVVFEKSTEIGGVWAVAYPEVRLQNISSQYHLSDFPWTFAPDLHPTQLQIRQYLDAAVHHLQIDVRLNHEVLALEEIAAGWRVRFQNQAGCHEDTFPYVLIATGQYLQKYHPTFAGEVDFTGKVVTEREIKSLDIFNDKCVAVVGFGKSAIDMTVLAAQRGQQVYHIFRQPRWLIPQRILGLHYTHVLFSRINSVMTPSWAYPTTVERFLHQRLNFIVSSFGRLVELILRLQVQWMRFGRDQAAADRLKIVQPTHSLVSDLRSATAVAPDAYYRFVAEGRIQPHQAKLSGFFEETIKLEQGQEIHCDVVVLSLGSQTPVFSFLPERYRHLLEVQKDGVQLYRHLIHPRVSNLAFVGFNHGFLHVPAVEIGTLWFCAYLKGELELPSVEQMEQDIEQVRQWKRAHIRFEPTRGSGVNVRYQQYIDILLRDLGVSSYRKMPNILAEIFARYNCSDYKNVLEEYNRNKTSRTTPLRPLAVAT
ncbi:NAD(P)/FAD-dependent oxidoreductase [Chroococcidiopsis sp. FACHB-1243]|uniref:flavin-containing monooxygenase n=1 Tax=Chroococcidiopsis sp. [FACHB-1243] TaxID=2692781 RepID=UPI001780913F|nr:NAD(P)/FAD-dependent oxidoreductase [Chroococcidiopsis sp. [FACHB-1243]]MBD2308710.1 NAD(P)/FAD-dependent oxidoreductase [Chroococcidiopsis sp. [FACHB-1243]]